jgi:hypothetical protein
MVSGVIGPIETKLLEFGVLGGDHAHEVFGLVVSQVVGAFSELSPAFSSSQTPQCKRLLRVWALKYLSYFARRKDHAFEMHMQSLVRFWGLTAQRGWARLILLRLDAIAHELSRLIDTSYARKCCWSCR